jgi:starvation-inducible outer membrane lipoprotein
VTRFLASLILTSLLSGVAALAAAVPLAAILDNPESYAGQQVTVVGTVAAPSIERAGETVYNLSVDDRRITVFGRGAAPALGQQVQVTAKVGWRHGDEEFTWPPILLESAHQPAP